jgi:molybdenum cofactor synthesis domain-containing protein
VSSELNVGTTAAIVTVGDEIVEGRILNENAAWLSDALMQRGIWPRLVVAVPDDEPLIVRVLRIAADAADLLFVCGGLGFTPDDITRAAVATAFYRDVAVHIDTHESFLADNAWANEDVATSAASFPVDAEPIPSPVGGVPGFRLRGTYVLPGPPAELRAMFTSLSLPVSPTPIHRTVVRLETTEDRIAGTLREFEQVHPQVRLGSYPDLLADPPRVTLVLVSRSSEHLRKAGRWLRTRVRAVNR